MQRVIGYILHRNFHLPLGWLGTKKGVAENACLTCIHDMYTAEAVYNLMRELTNATYKMSKEHEHPAKLAQ